MPNSIAMNEYALRQTAESNYSHYEGSFEDLCSLAVKHSSYRVILHEDEDGGIVAKITIPGYEKGFFSAETQLEPGMEITGKFEPRKDDEYPYISHRAVAGIKVPAEETDLILYNHIKLARKGENTTDAAWEIVSINAKRKKDENDNRLPHPVTMMRNHCDLPGGTKTKYTGDQFAKSIQQWLGGGPEAPFILLDC